MYFPSHARPTTGGWRSRSRSGSSAAFLFLILFLSITASRSKIVPRAGAESWECYMCYRECYVCYMECYMCYMILLYEVLEDLDEFSLAEYVVAVCVKLRHQSLDVSLRHTQAAHHATLQRVCEFLHVN